MNTANTSNNMLFQKFLASNSPAKAQTDSYNNFINSQIYKIFNDISCISRYEKDSNVYISRFGTLYIEKPTITPFEARNRDLTYECSIYIDIHEEKYENDILVDSNYIPRVNAFKIPTMVLSDKCVLASMSAEERVAHGECASDVGGYFIINGKERVLVSQERISYNHVFVFESKKMQHYKYTAEIRSMSDESSHSVLVSASINSDGTSVVFRLPRSVRDVDMSTVLIAFGIPKPQIKSFIGIDHSNFVEVIDSCEQMTQQEAVSVILEGSQYTNVDEYVDVEVFPHMSGNTRYNKSLIIREIVRKLYLTLDGRMNVDDRDNLFLRHVEMSGCLISEILKMHVKRFLETTRKLIEKRRDISSSTLKLGDITKGIRSCFSTGNWGIMKNSYIRTGVSQVMSRLSYVAYLSHVRRISIPVDKDLKHSKIRQIHPTQYGMVCVSETPEGMQIGTVKNMAITACVSIGMSTQLVCDIISSTGLVSPFLRNRESATVSVNGRITGCTDNPANMMLVLKCMRRLGIFSRDTCFAHTGTEIVVSCDSGRLVRPLVDLEHMRSVYQNVSKEMSGMTWSDLTDKGYIVYLDSREIETSNLMHYTDLDNFDANTFQNTFESKQYMEIVPYAMMGICAASIPFANHNQSPRNCYQASMMKQSIGVPLANYNIRADSSLHVLTHTQRPLMSTTVSQIYDIDSMGSGINAIVAIACYTGFNQEDSVILNQSAIDRGLFSLTTYKTISYEEKSMGSNTYEKFAIPIDAVKSKSAEKYTKIGPDGIIRKGSVLVKGDAIIAKETHTIQKDAPEIVTDTSIFAKHDEVGTVHNVICVKNVNGLRIIKVVLRIERYPEIGDKFASRSAQKGTLGMVFRQEDMPFTADGIVPDIIINPNAIPSRMTISQLLECVIGKKCLMEGTYGNADSFQHTDIDSVSKILESNGYEGYGKERMFNGFTGEAFDARIFIGPTYYQRLKHMVSDKIHARADGDVQILTMQPLEGRSRQGGMRLGNMEVDAMVSHGASAFTRERLYYMSDPYVVTICSNCGFFLSKKNMCRNCNSDSLKKVDIPYACKVLFSELEAMSIKIALKVK